MEILFRSGPARPRRRRSGNNTAQRSHVGDRAGGRRRTTGPGAGAQPARALSPAERLVRPVHIPYIFEQKGGMRFSPTVPKIAPSPAFEQESFGSSKEAGGGGAWKGGEPGWREGERGLESLLSQSC